MCIQIAKHENSDSIEKHKEQQDFPCPERRQVCRLATYRIIECHFKQGARVPMLMHIIGWVARKWGAGRLRHGFLAGLGGAGVEVAVSDRDRVGLSLARLV